MDFTTFTRSLIKEVGKIALDAFEKSEVGTLKKDASYVTQVDGEIERLIRSRILDAFPQHSIHGEEEGMIAKTSEYTWYLDPLDGTTNFICGIPIFGIMLSLYKQFEPLLATMFLPALDKLFWAETGKGAWINEKRLETPSTTSFAEITFQMEPGHTTAAKLRAHTFYAKHALKFRSSRRFGSYAGFMLGLGHTQPLVALHFHDGQVYEAATGALIFTEAGYAALNGKGNEWSLQDLDDLVCVPSNLAIEMKQMLQTNQFSNADPVESMLQSKQA